MTATGKFVYVEELAAMMRVSPRTVVRQIDRGELAAIKFGRRWLIPEAEVARLCGTSS